MYIYTHTHKHTMVVIMMMIMTTTLAHHHISYYIVWRVHHYYVRHGRRQTITQMCQIISSLMCQIISSRFLSLSTFLFLQKQNHSLSHTHTGHPINWCYDATTPRVRMSCCAYMYACMFTCSRLVLAGGAQGACCVRVPISDKTSISDR